MKLSFFVITSSLVVSSLAACSGAPMDPEPPREPGTIAVPSEGNVTPSMKPRPDDGSACHCQGTTHCCESVDAPYTLYCATTCSY